MARKSKGRGTAAAFGLLLLFAGIAGGAVLFALSVRRPTQAVEGFARAPVGCTTTLEFTDTGVFYVFEDLGPAVEIPEGGCEPTADPSRQFSFEISGPDGPVVPRADQSLSYDEGDYVGASLASVEIDAPGEYEITVVGEDPAAVAAIGRDPEDGVDELRRRAIAVAIIGIVLGALLLILAGRRSKKAAAFPAPDGPGWSKREDSQVVIPAPDITYLAQQPVNPHAPAEQVAIVPDLDQVDAMLPQSAHPEPTSPWGPPTVGDAAEQAVPAALADPAEAEQPAGPSLPEAPQEVAPTSDEPATGPAEEPPQDEVGTGSVSDTPPDEV